MAFHKRINGIFMKYAKKVNYIVIPTSSYNNNCGLHIIVPYLLPFLRNLKKNDSSAPALEKVVVNIGDKKLFKGTRGYQYFKEAFAEYYQISSTNHLAGNIEKLLEEYTHPQDMEMLLGPVLRIMMRKVLENSQEHKDSLKVSFQSLVNQCQQRYRQQFPRRKNKQHLQNWLAALVWSNTDEHEELFLPNRNVIRDAIFLNHASDITRYWDDAYQNYCHYQCDTTQGVYVSESQISLICASLKFDFRYVLPNGHLSESGIAIQNPLATVMAKNSSGIHWEVVTTKKSSWQKEKENHKSCFQGKRFSSLSQQIPYGIISSSGTYLQNRFRNQIKQLMADIVSEEERSLIARRTSLFEKALTENNLTLLVKMAKDTFKNEFDTVKDQQGNHILHVIAKLGTVDHLEALIKLKSGVDRLINLPNCIGNTPLHTAIQSSNKELIKPLLANNALVAKANLQGDTPLHIAAGQLDEHIVHELCSAGYEQNRCSTNSSIYFKVSARNKQNKSAKNLAKTDGIKQILTKQEAEQPFQEGIALIYKGSHLALKNRISKNPMLLASVDKNGDTLLHHAIMAYKQTGCSCLLIILNKKPNVNIKNKNGLTPLLLAAILGVWSVETKGVICLMIKYLKELGANMNETDDSGLTALHYAAFQNNSASIDLLVSHGAFIDRVNVNGVAPIHIAARMHNDSALKALIKRGAAIDIVAYPQAIPQFFEEPVETTQEITPLWLGLDAISPKIVNTLFDKYIAKNKTTALQSLRSIDGSTLLHFFAYFKDFIRFKQALQVGVDPFVTNNTNYLPFHSACATGALPIVKHYIEVLVPQQSLWSKFKGGTFDINDLPEMGVNALTLAGENNDIVQYLIRHGAIRVPATAERRQSTINKLYNFCSSQSDFHSQLESTTTNQVLNVGRIISSMLLSFSSPVGMGVAAAHQLLLYGMPIIRSKSSDLYYFVKPTVHNNASTFVETGLDVTASATSMVAQGIFTGLNWVDWVANPARRIAGYGVSMGMANLASQFTDNRQLQGAAYFFGRELGMFAVEAYQNYDRSPSHEAIDRELSKAFDLWTSLFGKEKGEWCVTWMLQFSQMHRTMQESVGWFEHTVLSYMDTKLETIRGAVAAVGLQALDESISSALSMVSVYPQAAYSTLQFCSRIFIELRQEVLTKIEHHIAENLLPDSEHRDVTLQFLLLNKTILLSQKLLEKKNEETTQDNKIKALEEEYDVLEFTAVAEKARLKTEIESAKSELLTIKQEIDALAAQVSESQEAYSTIWKKTPKGACEHEYREARQNLLNGTIKLEDLKLKLQFLEDHDIAQGEINEIQNQLQEAQTALVDLKNELISAEGKWLDLANPVEKKHLPKQNEEIEKHIAEQIALFKSEQENAYLQLSKLLTSQDQLADLWVDLRNLEQQVEMAKTNFDIIDLRIKAIDSPPPINSRLIVENALDQYPDERNEVVRLILNAFVATGMISYADAEQRIKHSILTAFKSHKHKDDRLNRVVTEHLNQLREDYRASLVKQRIQLQNENEKVFSELKALSTQYESLKNTAIQAKMDYETAQGGSLADHHLIEQIFSQPHNWDIQHNSESIKTTLTLMGQSNMTLGAMTDQGGPTSQWHLASSLAKTLVDYKYLFLTAPNIDVRLQEIDALATDLAKQTLDSNQIQILKQNWDFQIAQQLLNNSNTLAPELRAASIRNHLQNGFRYYQGQSINCVNEDTSFTQILTSQFNAQDDASATQAIVNVLQNQTQAISILETGVYVTPKNISHVPSKPHGLNRWWDNAKKEIKHYGKKIAKITGGASVSVGANGVSAGFTYGNQFRVMQFNAPKPPPLFTFPEKGQSKEAVVSATGSVDSRSTTTPSSGPGAIKGIKEIPHVVNMPWESESTLPIQPLIFSTQSPVTVQSNGVMTRSQAKQWEAQQTSMSIQRSNPSLLSIAQSSCTQLSLDNPFLQGILVEQLAAILNPKERDAQRQDKVKTNDHHYNTRQKARERDEVLNEFLAKPWAKEISAEMGGLGAISLHGSSITPASSVTESANPIVTEQLLKLLGIGSAEAMPLAATAAMGTVAVEGAVIHNANNVMISAELNERIAQIATAFQISLAHQIGYDIIGGDLTRKQRENAKLQQPYSGVNPDDIPSDLDYTSLPVVSSQGSKTESLPSTQLGINNYTFPLLTLATLFYEYRTNKDPEGWSKKGRMKAQLLPNEGKIRYIPPKDYHSSEALPRGPNNGFYDAFRNEWVKGPSRTPGEPFEWDIQLSDKGRKQLGWASRDQKHLNVSLKGKITHR